jgi:hypothetical protein
MSPDPGERSESERAVRMLTISQPGQCALRGTASPPKAYNPNGSSQTVQKLRVTLATVLLSIAGLSVIGHKALAAPGTQDTVPPQTCSTGTPGSSGVATGGTIDFTGIIGSSSGNGYGSGSGNGGSGSGDSGSAHKRRTPTRP